MRSELVVTRLDEQLFYVIASPRAERHDFDVLTKLLPCDGTVTLRNATMERGSFTIVGPRARDLLHHDAGLRVADHGNADARHRIHPVIQRPVGAGEVEIRRRHGTLDFFVARLLLCNSGRGLCDGLCRRRFAHALARRAIGWRLIRCSKVCRVQRRELAR